jgi:hypothetical protein
MRVADVRNIYAHVLEKPEPKPGELRTLTNQIRALVEATITISSTVVDGHHRGGAP